jgi:hypothetical protein
MPIPYVSCPVPVGSSAPPAGVCARSPVHVYYFLQLHMGTEPTPGFSVVIPNIVNSNSVIYINYIDEYIRNNGL